MTKHKRDSTRHKKKPILPHTLRDHIEALSVAVLLAVGLKYFLIEAYEIPTPSMQPTLMGSVNAKIHDRILVNKAIYLVREPQQWDIAVFHFPLNRSQNYVKRIVGMGGKTYRIAGGDIYEVEREGNRRSYRVQRKPAHVQKRLWKLVYSQVETPDPASAFDLSGATEGVWSGGVEGSLFAQDNGEGAKIELTPPGGIFDLYWHGYPRRLLRAMEQEAPPPEDPTQFPYNLVGDIRWSITVTPDEHTREVWLEEQEIPIEGRRRHFALRLAKTEEGRARARLELTRLTRRAPRRPDQEPDIVETLEGVSFVPGRPIRLVFTNVDDMLYASVDGNELNPIPYETRPSKLGDPRGPGGLGLDLHLGCKGGRSTRFTDCVLERDLYYRADVLEGRDVEVPPDHYWMLGDNTQNSSDGRLWKSVEIRVGPDGRLLPLYGTEGVQLIGNNRYREADHPVIDDDENPVIVAAENKIVFTDIFGEEHVLEGSQADYTRSDNRREQYDRFVPRRYIIGRALATFWPANPLGNFRLGLIR